nr:MAG TPA: hypothetical protein [Crassvirales sp.]
MNVYIKCSWLNSSHKLELKVLELNKKLMLIMMTLIIFILLIIGLMELLIMIVK